mmetsp:Transcript_34278/g.35566  ORF Transcript_34278/g.35566 Transcript_34278/m.35566 type:complete len:236 (+) Transcript_34278:1-708(+)
MEVPDEEVLKSSMKQNDLPMTEEVYTESIIPNTPTSYTVSTITKPNLSKSNIYKHLIYVNQEGLYVEISPNIIDISKLLSQSKDPHSGAMSLFIGTTRDNFEGKEVVHLEYEYHHSMAIRELYRIAYTAKTKYSLSKVILVHRVGVVPVTEESIVIISVSPHRAEAINATSYIIEEVKRRVPIWKKEFYQDEQGSNELSESKSDHQKQDLTVKCEYAWKENANSLNFDQTKLDEK